MQIIALCNTPDEVIHENVRINSELAINWINQIASHDGHAVIVGGGASLLNTIDEIKWRKSLGQKVFALNGAGKFLEENGVEVDYLVILDAREENTKFLQIKSNHTEYLISSQCHPILFKSVPNEKTTLWHPVIPDIESFLPKERSSGLTLIGGGTTVGLAAMCLVYAMGYRKIHLYGYDSCHIDKKSHAYDQSESNSEKNFLVDVSCGEKDFKATVTMAKQAECFPNIAQMLADLGCVITVHGEGLIPEIAKEMEMASRDTTLTAVYDLAVSPPTYDFISFLCAAEKRRLECGLKDIDVIFQPGPKNGFRDDNLPPDLATREGMLWRVCVASCRLLPSVKNVCVLKERMAIDRAHIFPESWNVNSPISHYGVWLFKGNPRSLTATQSATRAVKQIHNKYVTITLRQCDYWPERNSNILEWQKVDLAINEMGYQVIFVPDTDENFKDHYRISSPIFSLASWDIDLRMGLYENAFCNLLVQNGALALLQHSNAPYIAFKQIVPSCPSTTEEFWNKCGVQVGDQLSENGVMTWKDDTFENIMEAFNNFVKEKEKQNGNTLTSIRIRDLSVING